MYGLYNKRTQGTLSVKPTQSFTSPRLKVYDDSDRIVVVNLNFQTLYT